MNPWPFIVVPIVIATIAGMIIGDIAAWTAIGVFLLIIGRVVFEMVDR